MGPYEWKEKPESTWRHYPIRNQDGSGKCGPFAVAKALGINNFLETGEFVNLDTDYLYNLRTNSGPGTWMDEILRLGCTHGAPLDPLLLSDNNNDAQGALRKFTEEQKKEALKFRGKSRVYIQAGNFDAVAQAIDMGYTPIYLLNCAVHEWTSEPFVDPKVTPADHNIKHFVPAVEATIYNGNQITAIEDSWGSSYGKNGRRLISRHFFNNRVFAIGYIIDLRNEDIDKPKHTFKMVLTYGMSGPEVQAWQKVLQYEKYLPTHLANGTPLPMGYFGPMTASATKEWQVDHGITDFANEIDMKKIRFGKKSIAEANKIYS